jgi:hypothetical protein
MKLSLPSKSILLAMLALIVTNQPVNAKTMYRWVDENGKVSFSDQVPPSKVDLKRDELDKNANVVKVTEKAKTKAELELKKRLELLKKQQEKIIAEQKARDKKLLSSFLDIPTMDANYKLKILAFVRQEFDLNTNIKTLEAKLAEHQKKAASSEIKNQKIPAEVLKGIEATQKDIAKFKEDINQLHIKKANFEKEFVVDKARFAFLTKAKTTSAVPLPEASNVEKAVNELGLFSCSDAGQCEQAWNIAKEFVKTNSSTKINTDTDKLVMTNDPMATDISLSISKMALKDEKLQIFLDVRCQDSVPGRELCAGTKAQGFRIQFNDYIKTNLNRVEKPAAAETPAVPIPAKK